MKRILVVDDMAVFREPIAMALRAKGYQTICAENGEKALRLLRCQGADLVLLDVAMPVMDGLGFLRSIRAEKRFMNLPVVLLTAVAEKDYIIKAAKLGVRDYLLKSRFSIDELLGRVRKCLGAADADASAQALGDEGDAVSAAAAPQPEQTAPSDADPNDVDPTEAAATGAAEAGADADPGATPAESLKALKPVILRSELEARMDAAGELKAMSPAVGQLMKLTGSKDTSVERIAKAIKQDHAIALKVLKLANSAVYTRGEPVETIQNAVMRIGLSQIRQVAMNIAVIDRFSSDHERVSQWINTFAFWEHSIATGLIAAKLARLLGDQVEEVDTMFTAGLLHDVGRMVFIEQFGQEYAQVLKVAEALKLPVERVEKRLLLVDHADVMDRLLHRWKFARQLINPIALHHLSASNARGLAPKSLREVSILALANRLAHAMLLGSSGNDTIYPSTDFASTLKLDGQQLAGVLESVPDETADLKLVMLRADAATSWPDTRQDVRSRLLTPVHPLFAGTNAELDGYRVFADTIADRASQESPNIIVAHLSSIKDRDSIVSSIRRSETEAGAANLPIVIVSPKGDLTLDERFIQNRQCRLLASPTPVARFCDAVNQLLSVQQTEAHVAA